MKYSIGPLSQILTMEDLANAGPLDDSSLRVVEEGWIVMDRGLIYSVEEKRPKGFDTIEIDEPFVATPGLIDCHTHICYAGSRSHEYALRLSGMSYQEIANQGGGILNTVSQTRKATKEELKLGLKERMQSLMRGGVTTCEVKSGYGLNHDDEIKMLQAISEASDEAELDLISTCLAAHVCPLEFSEPKEYLKFLIADLLPEIKQQQLSQRVDIFVEEGAFSVKEAESYLQVAHQMGYSCLFHGDQFQRGGAELASRLHVLSIDHLEMSEKNDAIILAKAGVIGVVLPGASIGLGMQFAPARALLDAGVTVAIGSDWNPGSAPMGQLLTQAAILEAYEKLSMAEVWAGITVRAAKALELKDRGVIQKGMRADIALFPVSDWREILYSQGRITPSKLVIGGKFVNF